MRAKDKTFCRVDLIIDLKSKFQKKIVKGKYR